jgi:hypothetical protein
VSPRQALVQALAKLPKPQPPNIYAMNAQLTSALAGGSSGGSSGVSAPLGPNHHAYSRGAADVTLGGLSGILPAHPPHSRGGGGGGGGGGAFGGAFGGAALASLGGAAAESSPAWSTPGQVSVSGLTSGSRGDSGGGASGDRGRVNLNEEVWRHLQTSTPSQLTNRTRCKGPAAYRDARIYILLIF